VTRDEIQRELWPGDTLVDFERGSNSCIKQIRRALGDDAREPRYLETLPRRGYRFIALVELGEAGGAKERSRPRRWGRPSSCQQSGIGFSYRTPIPVGQIGLARQALAASAFPR
jgi:DNA-binding winged helix-turn-helix (wHTH) protein